MASAQLENRRSAFCSGLRGMDARVAVGEVGELQINTPFGMLGYLDNPELTDASFDGDYFGTGDLARMTAAGRVELIGRIKDIISRGGHKIAPLEIDNLLAQHPDVAAALCAGVPDDRLGEVIHAVVVPRHGTHLDAVALRDWLLARTERFKVPDVSISVTFYPAGRAARQTAGRLHNSLRKGRVPNV